MYKPKVFLSLIFTLFILKLRVKIKLRKTFIAIIIKLFYDNYNTPFQKEK